MSLMDLLLSEPSSASQILPMIQAQQAQQGGGSTMPGGGPSMGNQPGGYDTPPGRGIFGNNSVDPLNPNDPRLVDRHGLTLARPAMRSLSDVLQAYGYHGDAGSGYRSAAEQAALVAAKPGLAAPVGSSYHQEGLAVDLAAALQNAQFSRLMQQAGWNQFNPSGEPWHWSYGVTG